MPRKTKDAENEIKLTTRNSKKKDTVVSRVTGIPTSDAPTNSVKKASSSKKKGTAVSRVTGIPTSNTPTNSVKKSKKSPLEKKSTTNKKKGTVVQKENVLEYYDLPYRYNETTVKILAQTPNKLFIYWDISDEDRKNYIDNFGSNFFNNTVPVLIVHNTSMNYTFEVEINDFANCWYLDINDAKCEYSIELGRRSKIQNYYIPNNYIFVTSSNKIENPNDHILFEKQSNTIYFRNVKTNKTHSKDIANLSFIRNMGKIYNIYDAYKKLYNKIYSDENIIDINNPSSNNPTSTFR